MLKNTKTISDANGTKYIINSDTRKVITTMDKHGFIYNSEGTRTGNIHGKQYIEGCFY